MATQRTVKRLKWTDPDTSISYDVLVECAVRDGVGNEIATSYVKTVNNTAPVNGNVTLTIPSEITESTVSGWGFTKNSGTVTSVDSVSPTSGNVDLSAVRYTSQSLTSEQQTQARTNIGAGTSNFTGYTTSNKLSTDCINNIAGWTSNAGTITSVNGVQSGTVNVGSSTGLKYLTTAPSSANNDGGLIIVVLSSEPATKYAGYIYLITEA